jgi:hypothetical protein
VSRMFFFLFFFSCKDVFVLSQLKLRPPFSALTFVYVEHIHIQVFGNPQLAKIPLDVFFTFWSSAHSH